MTNEVSDEVFFDVQSMATPLHGAEQVMTDSLEAIAKMAAAALVLWFSFQELMIELREYRAARLAQRV